MFCSDNGVLKLFEFGFSAIGHPFMDFSFRLLPLRARKAFAEVWSVQDLDCTDMIPMIQRLTLPAYVIRILQVLKSFEGARESEKLEVAPLVEDLSNIILMILPEEAQNAESTVSYRSSTIIRSACRKCGTSFDVNTIGSVSPRFKSKIERH